MNKAPIRLGPLALLLTVVSICLAILAILTFTTARADLRLAEKYALTVRERYALEKEGQEYLAALNAGRADAPEAEVVVKLLDINKYQTLDTLKTAADGAFSLENGPPGMAFMEKKVTAAMISTVSSASRIRLQM